MAKKQKQGLSRNQAYLMLGFIAILVIFVIVSSMFFPS